MPRALWSCSELLAEQERAEKYTRVPHLAREGWRWGGHLCFKREATSVWGCKEILRVTPAGKRTGTESHQDGALPRPVSLPDGGPGTKCKYQRDGLATPRSLEATRAPRSRSAVGCFVVFLRSAVSAPPVALEPETCKAGGPRSA